LDKQKDKIAIIANNQNLLDFVRGVIFTIWKNFPYLFLQI